jgi:tetratricopeptide (TPR) repeat protein
MRRILLSPCVCIVGAILFFGCDETPREVEALRESVSCREYISYQDFYAEAVDQLRLRLGADSIGPVEPFFAFLDSTVDAIRPGIEAAVDWRDQVNALSSLVYNTWEITFDSNRDDVLSLLPHTILKRKRGSCLGVSYLFLLLAERLDIPLHGVLLPGHFFVRYDDGDNRRNIEPNLRGHEHPDSYYRDRYAVSKDSWYRMANLSRKQAIAVFQYNLGNIYQARGDYVRARAEYACCVPALPGFAEAWGNLAIALEKLGLTEKARGAFMRAVELRPNLPGLAQNQGALELRHGNSRAALKAYCRGLALNPTDPQLLYGAALASYKLGMLDSAERLLGRIDGIDMTVPHIMQLARQIRETKDGTR